MVANSSATPALRVTDPDSNQETVFELSSLELFQIGRARNNDIQISGDREVSREHARLSVENGRSRVTCLPDACNPIICHGHPLREIIVRSGDQFRIGRTLFEFNAGLTARADDQVPANQATVDVHEITLTSNELEHAAFGDPIRQLDLICTLPEMIASALSDIELARLLAELLLKAIPEAVAVSAAQFDSDVVSALRTDVPIEECNLTQPTTMRTCTREDFDGRFRPSRRLTASTLRSGLSTIQLRGSVAPPARPVSSIGRFVFQFLAKVRKDGACTSPAVAVAKTVRFLLRKICWVTSGLLMYWRSSSDRSAM